MKSIFFTWIGILALLIASLYLGNLRQGSDSFNLDTRQPAAAISK